MHSECDVRHLADNVSSIAAFWSYVTEAKAATYCAGRFINKNYIGAFFGSKRKREI